jgi:hypothetical protein
MKFEVCVTQECIDSGTRDDVCDCALAIALKQYGPSGIDPESVRVNGGSGSAGVEFKVGGVAYAGKLSEAAGRFVLEFDGELDEEIYSEDGEYEDTESRFPAPCTLEIEVTEVTCE